ncbi:MAG: zf-TFIIB domain-containing protein [Deltaproteobacteria bacterium]|nr:zf-TFIIB domain-containing protein [Deltaproteobacteria bacterium]
MPSNPAPCPHCGVVMDVVQARTRSGYCLLLDQCARCGGIWCDRWELYPLGAEEAARIDAVDAARLRAATPAPSEPGRCPRCTAPLRPFRDPTLPADARIERCATCDGMFMNRGELARLKRRSPRRPPGADAELIARVGAQLGVATAWSQVANLDAATYAAEDPTPATDDWRSALRSASPWLALAALIRLLLR